MISRENAIVRIVEVANELRRFKLDHYANWQTHPRYEALTKEYIALSEYLESFN